MNLGFNILIWVFGYWHNFSLKESENRRGITNEVQIPLPE